MKISINGRWFKDEQGRTLHLRGVNLGGSTKVPQIPNGATWNREGFYDHQNVSFVGKPFPLQDADEQFSRLKKWGLPFIRFLVTWEAIEHAGPGIYDEAYLDYVYKIVKKAAEYDLFLFIDPHQDVWSRFSGGDGAPGWTFESVGMDITKFHQIGATFTHQECGDPFPRMIWPSNYSKFACATMFTLFFGGNVFAPQTIVKGMPVQEFLQSHYINAMKQLAQRLVEFSHVVGYDTLNEPSPGYIGSPDLNRIPAKIAAQGPSPTIYQGMLLAAGHPQDVRIESFLPVQIISKMRRINPRGISLWREDVEPIWKQNGIWDMDRNGNPQVLKPDYFYRVNGTPVDFDRDFFEPFVKRYTKEIRSIDPEAFIFVSTVPFIFQYGEENFDLSGIEDVVYAPHWYDGLTLGFQRYISWLGADSLGDEAKLVFGRKRKRAAFVNQIKSLADQSDRIFGGVPTVIGEVGIPYNMNKKTAFKTGDFSQQIMAMDDSIQALESNLVNFTLWNYTADNSNERGDLWNDEDLSIFSQDQLEGTLDIHDGGRALEAVVRPYAFRIPGILEFMTFDIHSKLFEVCFINNPEVAAPLEIYVPEYQYPGGFQVIVHCGRCDIDAEEQKVLYFPSTDKELHLVQIVPK
jgi:hypothetical protein